jgi:hypothetical protein
MRYAPPGIAALLALLLTACSLYTTSTKGPFMDISWKNGEPRTASAGEQIIWWQYGNRDTVMKSNMMMDFGKVQNDTVRDVAVTQGVRVELIFYGFREGQLVVRDREFVQASSIDSRDDTWYPRGSSDDLMYFDLSKDSTVTIRGIPITIVSATPSVITYVVGGWPRRDESLLPPRKGGSESKPR